MIHMIDDNLKLLSADQVARIALNLMGEPTAHKFIRDINKAITYKDARHKKEFLVPVRRFYKKFKIYGNLDTAIIECAWDYSNNDSGLRNGEISSALMQYHSKVSTMRADQLSTLRYSMGIILKVAGFVQVSSTRRDFGDRTKHWRRGPGHEGKDLEQVIEEFLERKKEYIEE